VNRANHLAQKTNNLISQARSAFLSRLSNTTTKELWAVVNKARNGSCGDGDKDPTLLYKTDVVNDYFVKVSSKNAYDSTELDGLRCEASSDCYQPQYNFEVERILSKLKLTAAGCAIYLHRFCIVALINLLTL